MDCGICGTELGSSEVCPLCGTPRPTDISGTEQRVCSSCGSRISADAPFCRICGAAWAAFPVEGVSFSSELRCPSCGSSFPSGEHYCRQCGAILPSLSAYPAAKLRRKNLTLSEHIRNIPGFVRAGALLALAVAAAVILAVTLPSGAGGGADPGFTRIDDSFLTLKTVGDRFTVYLSDGSCVRVRCESFHSYLATPDRSAFLVADHTGECADGSPCGSLILVRGGEAVTVCEDASLVSYALSDSGLGAAYVTDTTGAGLGMLYLYDALDGATKKISTGVLAEGAITISPDGKSVAFIGEYTGEADYGCYISADGGEPKRVMNLAVPVAVTDGGELLYCYSGGILYAVEDGSETGLTDSVGYYGTVDCWFSGDYREVVYSDGGFCYISTDGGEGVKLADSPATGLMFPKDAAAGSFGGAVFCVETGLKNLSRTVWDLEGALWYLDETNVMRRIASSFDSCLVSENGASLLWLADGDLYLVKELDEEDVFPAIPMFDSLEVCAFAASPDLKYIYVTDCEGVVYYLNNTRARAVPGSLNGLDISAVTGIGTLYAAADSRLFVSKKGGEVSSADGPENCIGIAPCGGQLLITCEDGLYWGLNGDFRKLR